jgi:hypothetical protein
VIPSEPLCQNPNRDTADSLLIKALASGVLGSIWGRFRWWLHARRKGLYGPELKKFVSKRNKTGRYVFTLMAMDVLAQALMLWPKEGILIPEYSNEPLHVSRTVDGMFIL